MDLDLEITLRPHPMELNKSKELKKIFKENVIFDFDKHLDNLHNYKYLMTDWSGISLEYFYYKRSPVLFSTSSIKKRRS